MAISRQLNFSKPQLRAFARLFRQARRDAGLTQLQVATAAFDYHRSHCKVSRIERCAMPKVDAYCIDRMAAVLGVPRSVLRDIDPRFKERLDVVLAASRRGFWRYRAA